MGRLDSLRRRTCLGLLALAGAGPGLGEAAAATAQTNRSQTAVPSSDVLRVTAWIVRTSDNGPRPFIVVDKPNAEVLAYDRHGKLIARAPALLGASEGDVSVAGIGKRRLATIKHEERTTPAGRFVAAIGPTLGEKDVLWVDYEAAVSLHRVIAGAPGEHRLKRLQSSTPLDNRISYGCINVPVRFFEGVVRPAFLRHGGIVYILPDTQPLLTVFPLREAAAGAVIKSGVR